MGWFNLTHQEVLVSAPLPNTESGIRVGWQEVRVLTFHDDQALKTVRQRVRVEVELASKGAYGEAAVWASSTWKQVIRLRLDDLPALNRSATGGEMYAEAIDELFNIAAKVVGG